MSPVPAGAGGWRVLAPVFLVVTIEAIGSGLILPLLPFYATEMGAAPLTIGALISV